MHIYAFGSLCRGEIDIFSDIDLLAITNTSQDQLNSSQYSIYSYDRIEQLWLEGNPFAWHLFLESKFIYSDDKNDFLHSLGKPNRYIDSYKDCQKFYDVFLLAKESIHHDSYADIFDLSIIFLSIRNIATCYSVAFQKEPIFSRRSPLLIDHPINIEDNIFNTLEKTRISATRGIDFKLNEHNLKKAIDSINIIEDWILEILNICKAKNEYIFT